jgi:hypothetical protein
MKPDQEVLKGWFLLTCEEVNGEFSKFCVPDIEKWIFQLLCNDYSIYYVDTIKETLKNSENSEKLTIE